MFVKFIRNAPAGITVWQGDRMNLKTVANERVELTLERDGGAESIYLDDDGNLDSVYLLNDKGNTVDTIWRKPKKKQGKGRRA